MGSSFPLPLPALPTYAPGVVVAILFALASVGLLYRLRQVRSFVIYHVLTVFAVLRTIAYGTRAGWAKQSNPREITPILYVTNIAQAAGFVIIPLAMFHLLTLWVQYGLRRGTDVPKWEAPMFLLWRALLPGVQIITVIAAIILLTSVSAGDLSLLNTAMTIRNASWYAFLGINCIYVILITIYYFYFRTKTEYAKLEHYLVQLAMGLLMMVKLIFRTISVNRPGTDIINTSETILYCLDALPELLLMILAMAYNLKGLMNGMEQRRKGRKNESLTDTPPNEIAVLEKTLKEDIV